MRGFAVELTPSPATPPSEPEPDRSATRYRNSGRPLMVDGFTISLLLVLAAAYLPCLVRESQPTRADLRAVLRMAAVFLGARSHGQVEFFREGPRRGALHRLSVGYQAGRTP